MISYRTLLEVLKFTDPKETLTTVSQVNKYWSNVCSTQELWRTFLERIDASDGNLRSSACDKATYRLFARKIIIAAKNNKLFKYYISDTHFNSMTLGTLLVDPYAAAVLVSGEELFVCGGKTNDVSALSLNINSGTFQVLPAMSASRIQHGIILIKDLVYVFGGEGTASAEVFSLTEKRWSHLPTMNSKRKGFNPCARKLLIYLCGGDTLQCEVFDTSQQVYFPLPFSLSRSDWTVSLMMESDLVLFQERCKYTWNVELGGEVLTAPLPNRLVKIPCVPLRWGNMNPVRVGTEVFLPMFSCGSILLVNIETTESRNIKFPY